jgi:hypothetical protein
MYRNSLSFAEIISSLTLGAGCDVVCRVPQFSYSCCDDASSWVAPQKIPVEVVMIGGRRSPDAPARKASPWARGVTVVTRSPFQQPIFIILLCQPNWPGGKAEAAGMGSTEKIPKRSTRYMPHGHPCRAHAFTFVMVARSRLTDSAAFGLAKNHRPALGGHSCGSALLV